MLQPILWKWNVIKALYFQIIVKIAVFWIGVTMKILDNELIKKKIQQYNFSCWRFVFFFLRKIFATSETNFDKLTNDHIISLGL